MLEGKAGPSKGLQSLTEQLQALGAFWHICQGGCGAGTAQVVFPVWFSAGLPFVGNISEGGSLAGASQRNREMFFPFIFLVMLLPWLWACRNQLKESCKNIADMSWPKCWVFFFN